MWSLGCFVVALDGKADMTAEDKLGWTALHYSARCWHKEICGCFRQQSWYESGRQERMTLHYATRCGHQAVVRLLWTSKAMSQRKEKERKEKKRTDGQVCSIWDEIAWSGCSSLQFRVQVDGWWVWGSVFDLIRKGGSHCPEDFVGS